MQAQSYTHTPIYTLIFTHLCVCVCVCDYMDDLINIPV